MATAKPSTGRTRNAFGRVRKLPSGNWQASYVGLDGIRYPAPTTFQTRTDGQTWLTLKRAEIVESRWKPPAPQSATLAEFAPVWVATRQVKSGKPLKMRTRLQYERNLEAFILTERFARQQIRDITEEQIQAWYDGMAARTGPTRRWHAFVLLRSILNTAVKRRMCSVNPCNTIDGGGRPDRSITIDVISTDKLAELTAAIPARQRRYRMLVSLAAWSSLRIGELLALRREDVIIDLARNFGYVSVTKAVSLLNGEFIVDSPKTKAGTRRVALPPHILAPLAAYMQEFSGPGPQGLVFPSPKDVTVHLNPSTFEHHWWRARAAVGLPKFRFHDLRHVGNTYAAMAGATVKELMQRLGHATPDMALRYLHVLDGRPEQIATRMSAMLDDNVVDLASWRARKAA